MFVDVLLKGRGDGDIVCLLVFCVSLSRSTSRGVNKVARQMCPDVDAHVVK